MPKIVQLSSHVANLIAAGEVVERPASVVKELLENAVDAGASKITVEIQNGGMTFLRVTDNGCGMAAEDARTAFLRHATSKLRTAEDLAAISTMGFRGEALAAIASVSRIDLLTKTAGAIAGTDLHLDAGKITREDEVGCPDGTTIIVRDLFYNTPARMKFMKSDTYEGSKVSEAVQLQALAHPEVSFTFIKDGKQLLSTPGTGDLQAAVYCVYGRTFAQMAKVDSRWEQHRLLGYVTKPTDARPSRTMQTFFVNGRPVKSRLLVAALEEAYRNQLMVGKFPACVLHITMPANLVDVNVHPAKTEVKFLSEKAVFDCVHYGVLAALNQQTDRPQMRLTTPAAAPAATPAPNRAQSGKQDSFFRTMTAQEYQNFTQLMKPVSKPEQKFAAPNPAERQMDTSFRETVFTPAITPKSEPVVVPTKETIAVETPAPEPVQEVLPMPEEIPWRMVGELYNSYVLVEQGEDAYLIDKHAAHERILFEKLKANQEAITPQLLLTPVPVRLSPESVALLLDNKALLAELGFDIDEFGNNTVMLRQIPMDLTAELAAETLETIAADLMNGRRERSTTVRDEVLHTVACKAAIKAGWVNDEKELLALVKQVMSREDLKYCPHGRPICISLSKKQLEKQFKRS
ncbi:MAG: DNA mismatch repair endonuclease MutL [Oscillospiraceae bacterium]|nr:DNA mismatch repair endonuclease MutL [Oscillospiraceae bacterium]